MEAVRSRIEVVTADLTGLAVDAIVHAADPELCATGRVGQAIRQAAGPKLREECRSIGGCPPGEARMTGGYELPARWVIHAVGPRWCGGGQGEPGVLASAYTEALRLAERNEITTIAFPSIATGARGFPREAAARIAVRAVATWLVTHEWPRRVILCCFEDATADRYRALLASLER
ncbi:macro domain-containing protein [Myxococcota bacterium]|nr:macro domain-containing protein [Myxococcota bacterium]